MVSRVMDWQIAAEAAEWATRLDCGSLSVDERVQFASWLRTSPAHVEEMLHSASILAGLELVDTARNISIEDLLADTEPEVIPLFQGVGTPDPSKPASSEVAELEEAPAGRRWRVVGGLSALAASIVLVLAVSWYGFLRPAQGFDEGLSGAQIYATAAGEQRTFALEDGSVMHLNREARTRIRLSANVRLIELIEGEALFDVAPDADRPFRVLAGGAVAEAVGTKFTVKRSEGVVTVVVLEGKVRVAGSSDVGAADENRLVDPVGGPPGALLAAGQAAQLLGTGQTRIAEAGFSAAPWHARQLSFRDEGLSAIAGEFNRYNAVKIVVADATLASTRISGVFDVHDPESFIAFLELSAGVRVQRSPGGEIVLTAAE